MPWYKTGTVSVTQNSNAVIGSGTAFIANSRVGDGFRGPDGGWYEVTNIASDTAMSISPNYQGASNSAGGYALAPLQGYVKESADRLRALVLQYGDKMAALGTTGNYDILPVAKGGTGATTAADARTQLGIGGVATENTVPLNKGGTGRTDGRAIFSELAVQQPASLYGSQGLYMGWNSSSQGEANFIVNKGGGAGGFNWRSVNSGNTATGPSMSYSYDGLLTVPSLSLSNALPIASGGTGSTSLGGARASLGVGPNDAPTFSGIELSGSAYVDFHHNSSTTDYTSRIISNSNSAITIQGGGSAGLSLGSGLFPNLDGGINCGTSSNRFSSFFAVTGTIQTSDAREKTPVSSMTDAEVSAAMMLGKEIGTYKWLEAVERKNDGARKHIGLTVQRAIEIMQSEGLSPTDYAFICHDEWDAIERVVEEVHKGNIYSVGDRIYTNVPYATFIQYESFPAFTWEETSVEMVVVQEGRAAGDRYGFRYDQLALFIARGQEERIARLEAAIAQGK